MLVGNVHAVIRVTGLASTLGLPYYLHSCNGGSIMSAFPASLCVGRDGGTVTVAHGPHLRERAFQKNPLRLFRCDTHRHVFDLARSPQLALSSHTSKDTVICRYTIGNLSGCFCRALSNRTFRRCNHVEVKPAKPRHDIKNSV